MRVLVVDDDADARLLAAFTLGEIGGFEVYTCEGGPDVLEQAVTLAPDAILMDFRLPVTAGDEWLARLTADPRTVAIPVVFLTAEDDAEEHARLLAAGAKGVLVKPFDPDRLSDQLARLLAAEP